VYRVSRHALSMTQAVSVRLDDEALRALAQLEATGLGRSEAIRKALVEAASRLQDVRALASEVAALEADEEDRLEMLAVADLISVGSGSTSTRRISRGKRSCRTDDPWT